jgi:hypothetical protein
MYLYRKCKFKHIHPFWEHICNCSEKPFDLDLNGFIDELGSVKTERGYYVSTDKRNFIKAVFEDEIIFKLENIRKSIKVIFRNIKRIIDWIPILWKDEDWSDIGIYSILLYKIERTRINIDKNGWSVNSKKVAQNMRVAEKRIKKLLNEDSFFDEYYNFLKKNSKRKKDLSGRMRFSEFKHKNVYEKSKKINQKCLKDYKKYLEETFKYISDNIYNWND